MDSSDAAVEGIETQQVLPSGIDFLHFWLAPRMQRHEDIETIYDRTAHPDILEIVESLAEESGSARFSALLTENKRIYSSGFEPTGSPFFYSILGSIQTGSFGNRLQGLSSTQHNSVCHWALLVEQDQRVTQSGNILLPCIAVRNLPSIADRHFCCQRNSDPGIPVFRYSLLNDSKARHVRGGHAGCRVGIQIEFFAGQSSLQLVVQCSGKTKLGILASGLVGWTVGPDFLCRLWITLLWIRDCMV